MIHEKTVVRYEAVCDDCGKYLGEYADKEDARWRLVAHLAAFCPYKDGVPKSERTFLPPRAQP